MEDQLPTISQKVQWLYEDTFNWGNHSHQVDELGNKGSRSVMYVALRLLFYLGIRRIFLIGCDFRMEVGKLNYAFDQDRTRASVRGNNSSYEILNTRLTALLPYFEREGLEVWNCTPNSGLTAVPYLDFDVAHQWATSQIPPQIKTAGMYDRQRREREQEARQGDLPNKKTASAVFRSASEGEQITLVAAIDESSVEKLRHTWPTWMRHKPDLREIPIIIIHDVKLDPLDEKYYFLREHRNLRFVPWSMPEASNQREKMLTSLVRVPATEVRTPWYLKLDVDVVATGPGPWIKSSWFEKDNDGRLPAFISSPWGYTKPADALARLDDWGDSVTGLKGTPRLNLPYDPNAECISHPRVISWCFFGNTAWTREVADFAPTRLPCPSQDTYLFYCAARRGDRVVIDRMSSYEWKHVAASHRRLRRACDSVLSQVGEAGLAQPVVQH